MLSKKILFLFTTAMTLLVSSFAASGFALAAHNEEYLLPMEEAVLTSLPGTVHEDGSYQFRAIA